MTQTKNKNMIKILWATMVYDGDKDLISDYLNIINNQIRLPDQVLIVDAGNSKTIKEIVEKHSINAKYISLSSRTEINKGFNPSFNFSIQYAINLQFDYIVTMTIRCKPKENWLKKVLDKVDMNPEIGMVTTLHVDNENGNIHNLGHYLSNSGGLYDFGRGIKLYELDRILRYLNKNKSAIWCPCSGGALYNLKAVERSSLSLSKTYDIFHPLGFKSYNCSNLGYLLKSNNYQNHIAFEAICYRDKKSSTSNNPSTCGLLINQEINRIASILTFWPKDLAVNAIDCYINENRKNSGLKKIDKTIVLTLAENLIRSWDGQTKIKPLLKKHIELFKKNKELKLELNKY